MLAWLHTSLIYTSSEYPNSFTDYEDWSLTMLSNKSQRRLAAIFQPRLSMVKSKGVQFNKAPD